MASIPCLNLIPVVVPIAQQIELYIMFTYLFLIFLLWLSAMFLLLLLLLLYVHVCVRAFVRACVSDRSAVIFLSNINHTKCSYTLNSEKNREDLIYN